jgi:ABC-type glycerol-3-phosphate transport system permease component
VRRRYRWISLVAGALIVVMTYFPIVFVVSNSLKTGRNIFSSGVFSLFTQFDYQNYSTAWSGVSRPLVNTIIVAAASIALGVTAAALGAYAFSQLRFRGLPAAGRAAWLARRRPGLRPHRLLQPRRRRVLRQMAG